MYQAVPKTIAVRMVSSLFSSNALIQFAFANSQDTCFWGGLFKTDLDRYLWYELHDKYRTVYFVDINKTIDVYHLDERDAEPFKPKSVFGSPEAHFTKWMKKRLEEKKNPTAIVMTLEGFCGLLKNEEKLLGSIRESRAAGGITGTIVLVASPDATRTMSYLMNSPVFEYIEETSVLNMRTEENIENVFSLLKSNKQEACVFLNAFTKERISEILCQVMMESKNRFSDGQQIESMSEYLSDYFGSIDLQMKEKPLFRAEGSLLGFTFEDLYRQMRDIKIWNEAALRSRDYKSRDLFSSGIRLTFHDDTTEMRCLKLCVPGAVFGIYDEKAVNNLCGIYREILSPCNRPKDTDIEQKINILLTRLNNARQNRDSDTCGRIITAILFSIKWLYVDDGYKNDVMKIIDIFFEYEKLSVTYFRLKNQCDQSSFLQESLSIKLENYRMALENMDNVISVQITNLALSGSSIIVTDMFDNMQHVIEDFEIADRKNISSQDQTGIVPSSAGLQKDRMYEGMFDFGVPDGKKVKGAYE